jgi:hypothetical protein
MFSSIRIVMIVIMLGGLTGGAAYIYKLKADNEVLKANNAKLEDGIAEQKAVIEQQMKDFKAITAANDELRALNSTLKQEFEYLDKRFNKDGRDIGQLAVRKPDAIQRIITGGSKNAMRCVEIAMGSPLTEKEKTATKKSEINTECPSLANPAYKAYNNE